MYYFISTTVLNSVNKKLNILEKKMNTNYKYFSHLIADKKKNKIK